MTRLNAVGSTMHREELGRQGGGRLFYLRRERALARGLLSAMGRGNDYLVFQPSIYFSRTLGGRVLRLNEALSEVRGQGAELIPSVGVARLQAHYQELERIIEAARDRLGALIDYCHKGATGRFREALEDMESVPPAAAGTPEGSDVRVDAETAVAESPDRSPANAAGASADAPAANLFEVLRNRHFDQGILTEYGRDQGCVAFQPSPFFGRFLGEVVYSLNDALRRLEGNAAYHVLSGDGDTLQRYFGKLENGLAQVGRDADVIIACCRREVA